MILDAGTSAGGSRGGESIRASCGTCNNAGLDTDISVVVDGVAPKCISEEALVCAGARGGGDIKVSGEG
jgi:hypothetical protein